MTYAEDDVDIGAGAEMAWSSATTELVDGVEVLGETSCERIADDSSVRSLELTGESSGQSPPVKRPKSMRKLPGSFVVRSSVAKRWVKPSMS